jgi:hypothetical protein
MREKKNHGGKVKEVEKLQYTICVKTTVKATLTKNYTNG